MAERADQYAAAHHAAAGITVERGVVRVTGPEAETYLQGQLSQDVARLAPGEAAWSLILAPAGRVDALVRVVRGADDDGYLLDTDAGWGARSPTAWPASSSAPRWTSNRWPGAWPPSAARR